MSMASFDRPAAFRIGRVFGDTFSVLGRNFGLCLGLAAIFSGIPTFLFQLWSTNKFLAAAETGVPPEFDPSMIFLGLGAFLAYMVLSSILQAALVRTAIEDLNGQQPSFADSLSRGIAVVLPVIGLSILAYLGIMVGMFLLIIPGIYLFLRWSAALPVLVQERLGVFESMSRSAVLTKGNRWRILGLFVIMIVIVIVLQTVLNLLVALIVPVAGIVVATALQAVLSAVSSVIVAIANAVAYVELRYVKEGTDVKELAEIFA